MRDLESRGRRVRCGQTSVSTEGGTTYLLSDRSQSDRNMFEDFGSRRSRSKVKKAWYNLTSHSGNFGVMICQEPQNKHN
ncbi:hypothetical protein Sjap_007884 [Stephania japonica]|uniref:Uncharacterized protein n=1 Tax=Stephania japonica TaxID=461633 RepID=A0AAP0PE32_9MAGN